MVPGGSAAAARPRAAGGYPPSVTVTTRRFGAQSMSAPLLDVLVKRPGPAFGAAFDDPAHGFLHPVDLDLARREHDAFVDTLASLGPTVHVLEDETDEPGPRLHLRPAAGDRPRRRSRCARASRTAPASRRSLEAWTAAAGIPTVGRIEAPGTVEGGDTFWLRPDLFCIGRTLRTNDEGARQLGATRRRRRARSSTSRTGAARPSWSTSCRVISPVADDLAVVYLPLLPVGLWELLGDLGIRHGRGARRGVPDARLQRAGGPARRRHPGRGQPADVRPRSRRPAARSTRIRRPRSASTARAGRPA